MKTMQSIKVTSFIQIIYCVFCLVVILLLIIGTNSGLTALANIGLAMFYCIMANMVFLSIPIVCFFINLVSFLKERKDTEQKKVIGKKWIWIFVLLIISMAFTVVVYSPFVGS